MTVAITDIKYFKSETVTNTTANGGRSSTNQANPGTRHNLFPRVTAAERTAGVTRYRKVFWGNTNSSDESAYDAMVCLGYPSPAGDRFYIGKGTHSDTQSDTVSTTDPPSWCGIGTLQTSLVGGETSVVLTMESNDFQFPNGGYLYLSDAYSKDQSIASGVIMGGSVTYNEGTLAWAGASASQDITYTNGIRLANTTVMSIKDTSNQEWLQIAANLYTGEIIGTGNGSSATRELTTLTHNTKGICKQRDLRPLVYATCGSTARTVYVWEDGSCTGYCSAGALNMTTGVWTTDVTWLTAPDNGTNITCTYRENAFSYSGNDVTVSLASGEQVANAYSTANTYGAGCVYDAEVIAAYDSWVETSTAGTFDETTYPPVLTNKGSVTDTWTITFTSGSAYTCSGASEGSVGSGVITEDFSPTNSDYNAYYFTIDKDGWGGTWVSGDTVVFKTYRSEIPLWMKQVVPALTAEEPNNLTVINSYFG